MFILNRDDSGMLGLAAIVAQTRPRFRTASSFVTDTLRSAILAGVLGDGEPLRQDDLAAALGVSRMPVREALRRLEAEGLVDFQPHKGAVVAELSPEEVEEIYEMRLMAECHALRQSIPYLTEDALDRAAIILDEIDAEQDDLARWGELNQHFHTTLYSGVVRRRLNALISSLNGAIDRYLRVLITQFNYQNRSQDEHRLLLAACRRHDVDTAMKILSLHITEGRNTMVEFLRKRRGG
jgi:DNA-binding GntR family transcriptional regulator